MAEAIDKTAVTVFDVMAEDYDDTFSYSRLGKQLRELVWTYLEPLPDEVSHVLELGCGTGVDAYRFAGMGFHVSAVDSSPRMIEVARTRLADAGERVNLQVADIDTFEPAAGNYQLIFSNFGALNCLTDPASALSRLSRVQRTGDRLFIVLINKWCLWEILWFSARANFGAGLRRLGTARFSKSGHAIEVSYPSTGELTRALGKQYRPSACHGVGFLLPPTYLSGLVDRWPGLFDLMARIEARLSGFWPFNRVADHVVLVFEKRQSQHSSSSPTR